MEGGPTARLAPTQQVRLRYPVVIVLGLLLPGFASLLIRGWREVGLRSLLLLMAIPLAFVVFGPLWGSVIFAGSPQEFRNLGLWPFVAVCVAAPLLSVTYALKDRRLVIGRLAKSTLEKLGQVVDLRSSEDRGIAQRARDGQSLGPEIDSLVAELIEIGERDEFITINEQRENVHDPRAKEIGRILELRGGRPLMQAAYYKVEGRCGSTLANHLSYVWSGIGGWMA